MSFSYNWGMPLVVAGLLTGGTLGAAVYLDQASRDTFSAAHAAPVAASKANTGLVFDVAGFEPLGTTYAGIWGDVGGEVVSYEAKYAELRTRADKVYVGGLCASACTFVFGYFDKENICVTNKASFGFHGIYDEQGNFSVLESIMHFSRIYPEWLLKELYLRGWRMDKDIEHPSYKPYGMLWISGDALGLQRCPSKDALTGVQFLP